MPISILVCIIPWLRNHHIDFFRSCSDTTTLLTLVLPAFQLPIKKTGCFVFMKQFIVKNYNNFQSGLSDIPSSENAWISNFFMLHKTYICKEQLIKLIKTFINIHSLCVNSWFSFHCISNVIQEGNISKSARKRQHLETFKSVWCKIVSRSSTNLHFWGWMS